MSVKRGYKGGRKSSTIDSRPPSDAYRAGWERMFGKTKQKEKKNG
jgi:hypothetical protein